MNNSDQAKLSVKPESIILTKSLVFFFAICCGVIVANIYYSQPIISMISPDIHLSKSTSSLIVSITQIGYCIGLVFLVHWVTFWKIRS